MFFYNDFSVFRAVVICVYVGLILFFVGVYSCFYLFLCKVADLIRKYCF